MSEIIHEVELPSKGLPYSKESGITLNITIRAITTAEEKLIFGSGTDQAITKALKKCIVDPKDIDLGELTIPDKHFLIVAWRTLSYGPDYETRGRCPVCGQANDYVLSIQDMVDSVTWIDENYLEPYEIELPNSKDHISLRYLRDKDIRAIEREVSRLRRTLKTIDPDADLSYSYRLASFIHSINGNELSLQDKVSYVDKLTARDTSYIKHYADKMNNFGILPTMEVECKTCSSPFNVYIPVDTNFFRAVYRD